jgi:CxxC-x17-CxxC domain-containing protein
MAEDTTLTCGDCNAAFTFTAGEQEFYETKGFTPPKRCPDCRTKKKNEKFSETEVVCAGCGVTTTVPFKPVSDKPVYCRDCFDKNRA